MECGTGRNFAHLREAVGPEGHIYGVDFSEGMLRKAREICTRRGWGNVILLLSDATAYRLPERVDGALFSLCYATMPHIPKPLPMPGSNCVRAGVW